MICYRTGDTVFNYRAAGIALTNGMVLLHKFVKDDFWALPGGRVELNENYFTDKGTHFHEIGFYFEMNFNESIGFESFKGREDFIELQFNWFSDLQMPREKLYPEFFRERLFSLSTTVEHIVTGKPEQSV